MNTIIEALRSRESVSGWKLNIHKQESYELFFVKGKLETLRRTDTCDKQVTVYVQHGDDLGDSQFYVYPSTTPQQLEQLIDEAVAKALLINNPSYTLPDADTGDYQVESNFHDYDPAQLASEICKTVFDAGHAENSALNSLEVFINRHEETVCNSRGLEKKQLRYSAMVEAIPTYNGAEQSVELYEQYNFGHLDTEALSREIAGKMAEVKARYEAVTPDFPLECKVILNPEELSQLFMTIASDANYASVYSNSNLFKKGDSIQSAPVGDKIGITMAGEVPGCIYSRKFDSDGMALNSIRLIDEGKVVNYYGSNRFGQYLGEEPTGALWCFCVDAGSADSAAFSTGPYLEVVSMSGLQVDSYSDYVGGEIRLAYYHDGEKMIPVTGISISGKLSEVLNDLHLSRDTTVFNSYCGPAKAMTGALKIFSTAKILRGNTRRIVFTFWVDSLLH